jgi:hypothetical protein
MGEGGKAGINSKIRILSMRDSGEKKQIICIAAGKLWCLSLHYVYAFLLHDRWV